MQGLLWIAALAIFLPIGACNCNNSVDAAADRDSAEAPRANPPKSDDTEGEELAEEIPDDVYQDFSFAPFDQGQRQKLVRIFKAELCPCPDSNTSMHECLKTRETRCGLAEQTAGMAASMVNAAYSETDVLDKIAEFVENSKKVHEFTLDERPHKGKPGAPVVIVEFADFQCPHCREASKVVKALHEKHPDKVVVYFKNYPLTSNHPMSQLAAQAAVAAHRQGKFWQMHDLLFENQRALSPEKLDNFARQIGLNMQKFKTDFDSAAVAAHVTTDRGEAERAGLTGTPTFYINGRRHLGETSLEALEAAVVAAADADDTTTTETD